MSLVEEEERDLDRRRSDWALDEWDEVAEVPAVEPLRQQTRIVKWVVWVAFALVVMLIIVAGYELATAKDRDRYVDAFRGIVTRARESDARVHIAVTSTRVAAPLIRMSPARGEMMNGADH